MSKDIFFEQREREVIEASRTDFEHRTKLGDDRTDYQQLEHEQRQPRTKDVARGANN